MKRHCRSIDGATTHISYLEKTYTTTAQEPSIYYVPVAKPIAGYKINQQKKDYQVQEKRQRCFDVQKTKRL